MADSSHRIDTPEKLLRVNGRAELTSTVLQSMARAVDQMVEEDYKVNL